MVARKFSHWKTDRSYHHDICSNMRILLSVILFVGLIVVNAFSQRTTRGRLQLKDGYKQENVVTHDTIVPDTGLLKVSGYDKPLYSRRETFFVTNQYGRDVSSLKIELNYYDESGRQLHAVTRWVKCSVPAHSTRQVYLSSWDKQHSFYYYRSAKPRRQATPYKVTHRILAVTMPIDSAKVTNH